ncbi:molecular chaperone DnaJ [Aphanothece hegewaldii CCALA 016]|uniref:Molecular chaperone DnaJ n=1 Tax=Aphanothece hegewaldii CCALA 016 TaxID=2107694 RepID=A0A2T1LRZ1_9CHRO|nr:IMS domain-containing protein [Aphanothece hegewaldii]PSF32006.1 molecular chaperone DnaJ [Aphanothece hegewaldii CCALA 016]
MQISLDYYRILGVPIQATDEQLQQAYQDRSSQLPRREYGDFAIASRKYLLDQAYHILADPEKRSEYDQHFLEQNSVLLEESSSAQPAGIEIPDEQLVGGLLILQELGEYELVIGLGENFLNQISDGEKKQAQRQDIIFTLAIAYLELSREKWEQQDYETAATISQKGLKWLEKEQLFPQLQDEIWAEYYKLRPYRILNFLSLGLEQQEVRVKGLQLLQEMLQERQGIDGLGNDGSGLNPHRFLLYIQQLRPHLTINEQLAVFESVSRSNNAVDACFNVYIFIGFGFAFQQPDFILKATSLLEQLSKYQDVYLEQAICALLLGQTKLANLSVKKTQEIAALNYIREHSENEQDLLLGLYQYAEKWLQTEVYPQFRDLKTQQVSLKDYFADESVQNYLEQVSDLTESEMSPEDNNLLDQTPVTVHQEVENDNLIASTGELDMRKSALSYSEYLPEPNFPQRSRRGKKTAGKKTAVSSANSSTQSAKEQSIAYTDNNLAFSGTYPHPAPSRPQRKKTSSVSNSDSLIQKPSLKKKTRPKRRKFRLAKPLLMGLCLLGGLSLAVLTVRAVQERQSPLGALQREQLNISLNEPPIELPLANTPVVSSPTLTKEDALQVIQTWLDSKKQAFGTTHNINQLKSILAEPLLSDWQKRAIALQKEKNFWQYQHELKIESVTTNIKVPERATVVANVREKAQFNQNGQIVARNSYDKKLSVKYELVRQNEQWLIQDIKVMKSS